MRAISLWPPWSSLIAIGAKKVETRSWHPPPRLIGLDIVIHAAQRWTMSERRYALFPYFKEALEAGGVDPHHPPRGAALCIVTLERYQRTELIAPSLSPSERAFGNYESGRWAWFLSNVRVFPKPILMGGYQGLFNVSDDLIEQAIPLEEFQRQRL